MSFVKTSEQTSLLGRVSNRCSLHARERRQLVVTVAHVGKDVDDGHIAYGECVGNEPRSRSDWHHRAVRVSAVCLETRVPAEPRLTAVILLGKCRGGSPGTECGESRIGYALRGIEGH